MRRFTCSASAAIAAMSLAGVCLADDDKVLTIGDEAPKLDIAHWVKTGEKEFEGFKEGNVYVVEFWATWCGPCKASMPHLSDIEQRYADYPVTIIGISDEPLSKVVEFLCSTDKQANMLWNDKIGYTLATDPDRSCHKDYMEASGQRGIPTAFIVGFDGRVEWIGHPMSMDEPLEQVVKDTWDRESFLAKWEASQAAERERAKQERELRSARERGDYAAVLKGLDAMLKDSKDPQLQMAKFNLLLVDMNKPEQAYEFAATIVQDNWNDALALNQIAWYIVDEPNLPKRDLDLALKAAVQASKLTGDKDPMILDTLARAYYEKGDIKNAVKWQREAVKRLPPDSQFAASIKAALEKYEQKAE